TPRRASVDAGLGLGTTLQAVPSQCSVRVCPAAVPTAQTSPAETLSAALSWPPPATLGLGTTTQAAASAAPVARTKGTIAAMATRTSQLNFSRFTSLLTTRCPRESRPRDSYLCTRAGYKPGKTRGTAGRGMGRGSRPPNRSAAPGSRVGPTDG